FHLSRDRADGRDDSASLRGRRPLPRSRAPDARLHGVATWAERLARQSPRARFLCIDRHAPARLERRALRRRAERSDRPRRADHRCRAALDRAVAHATGSFFSGRLSLPADSFAATSYEMLAGGLILLPIGLATSDPHFSQFSGRSIFGFFYLVT